MAREGLVVRALAWPGLLSAGAMVGAALLVGAVTARPEIAVAPDASPEIIASLNAGDLYVITDNNPRAAVAEGRAARGVWREDGRLRMSVRFADLGSLRAEAALREAAGAAWRIDVPPPGARPFGLGVVAGLLAGLVGVLFTLYGAVMGAGTVAWDRDSGVLEADLGLPVSPWVHGAARLLATTVGLAAALVATMLLLHGLLGIQGVEGWIAHSVIASASGAALGLWAMGGRGEGFSGPLSRALAASLGAMSLGFAWPVVGGWLPMASLTALARSDDGSAVTAAIGACLLSAAAVWRFGQRGLV